MSVEIASVDQELSVKSVENLTFNWTIENFPKLLSNPTGVSVNSHQFIVRNRKLFISLFPNGETENDKDFISLFINVKEGAPSVKLSLQVRLYILNNTSEKIPGPNLIKFYAKPKKRFGDSKFFLLEEVKKYLKDGKLRVIAELTITEKEARISDEMEIPKYLADYSEFLNEEVLSDVEIINADDESVRAHKIILSNNSTYFAGMFKHPMKENLEGRVCCKDISSDALGNMLKFLYCGKLENTDININIELIQELLPAADIYGVLPLKWLCEELLIQNLSSEIVVHSLELGETYQCPNLRKAAMDWIIAHKQIILKKTEWKEFVLRNFDLAHKIMLTLLQIE